jgi:streptogramin lyase
MNYPLSFVLILSAMLASASIVRGAEPELLGEPCRAFNFLSGRVIKAPDGREYLVVGNMNENTGCELIFIDFHSNTGKTYRAPNGAGAWALNRVPGDRLVVGTFYDGHFMVFDLKEMKFTQSVGFPGEEYIWNLAIGNDGRVYGGTYPHAKLGAIDLNSYKVEDLGAPSKGNTYLRNVSSTPDGRILCQFGMKNPQRLLFDPKTKKFDPVPDTLKNVDVGVTWNGYFIASASWEGKAEPTPRFFKGEKFEVVNPPFEAPKKDWVVDTYPSDEQTLYYHVGDEYFRIRAGETKATPLASAKPRGRVIAAAEDGTLLGVNPPDYWLVKPGSSEVEYRRVPVESGPRETHFLEVAPDGKLWGGPTFGQTVFWLDPKTKKYENTRQVCSSGGEVYDATFVNGKVYMVAYVGGDVIAYDPQQPWDQFGNKNPKTIAHLTERGYIRPVAGITLGPDGNLYSGWLASYGKYGGAISITDPATEKTDLIENPLGQQGIGGVATDGEKIYAGSTLAANGLPNKSGESVSFGVIDSQTKKVTFQKKFEGVGSVSNLVYEPKSNRVMMTTGKTLAAFDTTKNDFVDLPRLPAVTGKTQLKVNDDGKVYGNVGKSVLAIDPMTGESETVASAPEEIAKLAIAKDGAIYASCGTKVFRLK